MGWIFFSFETRTGRSQMFSRWRRRPRWAEHARYSPQAAQRGAGRQHGAVVRSAADHHVPARDAVRGLQRCSHRWRLRGLHVRGHRHPQQNAVRLLDWIPGRSFVVGAGAGLPRSSLLGAGGTQQPTTSDPRLRGIWTSRSDLRGAVRSDHCRGQVQGGRYRYIRSVRVHPGHWIHHRQRDAHQHFTHSITYQLPGDYPHRRHLSRGK